MVTPPGRLSTSVRSGGAQIVPRPDRWAPGPPPPWASGASAGLDEFLSAVSVRERPMLPAFPDARPAAVLVALADGADGPSVLLTRRSWELRHHRGEISFPGGRMDPGETPLDTALREADEEVGLDPRSVRIHGELEHLNTVVSRSYIVPKVGALTERVDLVGRTMEVDRVIWVPLAELTRPDTYRSEVWGTGATARVLHFFHLDDETIWGATGRMLYDLLEKTLAPDPT
ncbi:MAG: NUDIX hydrolase [Ilumatobacteraceae bacterium]